MTLTATLLLVARVAVGAALGGVIGFERDIHGRPVGLRTHLLVAMASATFTVVSTHFVYWQHYGKDDLVNVDSSRIAASVVSAVGFLGAGSILRTGLTVRGLTTAAGLWLVTAIGMSAGAGMYVLAIAVTAMGIATLTVLRRLEDKDERVLRRRLSIVVGDDGGPVVSRVVAALGAVGVTASEVEYERRLAEGKRRVVATFDVAVADAVGVHKLIEVVEALPGVRRVRVQSAR